MYEYFSMDPTTYTLSVVAGCLAVMLSISELLASSDCKSNSIYQFLFGGCTNIED
jgi:hypothetical protein